ncbi:MAG: ABC transporter permease [Nitrospira sp.]|nr:ABC transporter permease [Nitrospira sp.]
MGIFLEIHELYRYRELLRNLVSRDIKKRYKRSTLGFLWVMLDPLLIMLIFYIIFAGIFGRTVGNYTAYVISGIIMWQLFAQGTKVASLAFINNRSLINKLYLPKSIFPLSVVASSLVHFIFALVPLFAIILFSGTRLSYDLILLPFVVALIFIFSLGISLTVSTLAVFFHDVVYIYDVLLLAWMYLSAIFYPISILPKKFLILMSLNPVYHYISLFRAFLYDNTIPTTEHIIWGTVFALFSFLVGWVVYLKNKDRIIFYL